MTRTAQKMVALSTDALYGTSTSNSTNYIQGETVKVGDGENEIADCTQVQLWHSGRVLQQLCQDPGLGTPFAQAQKPLHLHSPRFCMPTIAKQPQAFEFPWYQLKDRTLGGPQDRHEHGNHVG